MKNILFYIILILSPLTILSENYKISENEFVLELNFKDILEEDTLNLPNYLKKDKEGIKYLKFTLALNNNNINEVRINNKKIDYTLEYFDNIRNIELYNLLIPQSIFTNNSKLEILYDKQVELSDKKELAANLFSTVINKKHLNTLLKKKYTKAKINLLNNDDKWYDYETKYLKIITNRDAIYKIDINRIIDEFGAINISNLHISNNGCEYNNFFIKSNDNIISSDDEFYLYGHIAKGDTTYYEHYTSNVIFYLYYDASKTNNSLKLIENNNPNELKYVNRNIHFEEELEYSYGDDFRIVSTKNNYNEGWVLKSLDASVKDLKSFTYNSIFFPYNKEIEIVNRYSTINSFYKDSLFNIFNIHHHLNNTLSDTSLVGKYQKIDYKYKVNNSLLGVNSLKVETKEYLNNFGLYEPSKIAIDYFDVNGKFYPIANDGRIEFTSNENNDNFVNILNLTDNKAISIDTNNKTIEFVNAVNEDFISGGINFLSNYSTLVYNSTSIHSNEKSILIIYSLNDEIKSLSTKSIDEVNKILSSNLKSFVILSNLEDIGSLNNTLKDKGITTSSKNFIAGKFGNEIKYKDLSINDNNYISTIKWENAISKTAKVNINKGKNHIFVSDYKSLLNPEYEKTTFGNLRSSENRADILYVTHSSLKDGVQKYLDYRKSTHPDLTFKVVYIEDIYNEFSAGKEGPQALKRFLEYAYHNWESPKFSYLYLIGETSWDSDLKGKDAKVISLVPTFGLPVSDIWYNNLDTTNKSKEEIFTSRLTAKDNQEIETYLNKLKEFEKNTAAPWFKNTLQVIGGGEHEKNTLRYYTDISFRELFNSNLGVDTTIIASTTFSKWNNELSNEIRKKINNGVLWTNFAGHGAVKVFDFDGWAETQLNNFGKTGILSTISCNTLAFGESATPWSRNEAYIMYPKTGFVFTYGGTTLGTVGIQNHILTEMLKSLSDENLNLRNVLEIKNYGTSSIEGFDVTFLTFNTLGDPLIEIPISKKVELYSLENEVLISSKSNFISVDDTLVNLSAKIYNNGICTDSTVKVKIIHTYGENQEEYYTTLEKICAYSEFNLDIKTHSYLGLHKIEINIDPDNDYDENDKNNNIVTITYNVFAKNILPIEPKNNWNISSSNPKFKFFDPSFDKNKEYKFVLSYNGKSIESNMEELIIEDEAFISWIPNIQIENGIDVKLNYEISNDENSIKNQYLQLHTKEVLENNTKLKLDLNKVITKNLTMINNSFQIKDDTLDYAFKSNNGPLREKDQDPYHTVDFQLGDDKLLALTVAETGIYSVRVSKYNKYEPIVRYYETYGYKGADKFKDDAIDFIKMLNDSISNDDYIFLTVIGSGMHGFQKVCGRNEYCYIDSLKEVLKFKFNATLTDTLKYNDDNIYSGLVGYTLFSSPDFDSSEVNEKVGLYENEIYTRPDIEGKLLQYNLDASIDIPVTNNVEHWHSIKVEGQSNNSTIKLEIYDESNKLIEEIENYNFNEEIDLSKYNNQKISFKLNLQRASKSTNLSINDIILSYKAYPELGIVKTNNDIDTLLRGDDFSIDYSIKNYSFRNDIFDIKYSLRNNNQLIFEKNIDTLAKSTSIHLNDTIITNNLSTENIFIHNLNNHFKNKEDISNNNQIQKHLYIYEDTIPPVLKVYYNDQLVYDQMYISETPLMKVEMYDNSKLPINEVSKFSRVKLNRFIDENELIFNNDFNFKKDGNLKATIEFTSDYIEFGEYNTNFLTITAEDASGNDTTVSYYLNLARLVSIKNFIPYPNPFSNELYLEFEYKGSIEPIEGEIIVFDVSGRLIKNLPMKDIKVGKNSILWDTYSNEGSTIAVGNYIVLIKLNNGLNQKESAIIQKK